MILISKYEIMLFSSTAKKNFDMMILMTIQIFKELFNINLGSENASCNTFYKQQV